jgi:hypothetical protein
VIGRIPATPVYPLQKFYIPETRVIFNQYGVIRMARGERESGRRSGEGYPGRGIRGRNNDGWDPVDLERDPYRDLKDGFEDLTDALNDEYIWPSTEEEEDD